MKPKIHKILKLFKIINNIEIYRNKAVKTEMTGSVCCGVWYAYFRCEI